jgi:L-fucose mutarotase
VEGLRLVLRYDLIHPPLIEALGIAGHGSKILIADGNFPYLTVRNGRARLVHLNVAPGLLDVTQVLELAMTAVNFESAVLMDPGDGTAVAAHDDYRARLGPDAPFDLVDRWRFYELARSDDVGLIVATGDQRLYANLILTVGLR